MIQKKRHGDDFAPALFPFLAVLLCTIGALILILAITVTNSHASARRDAEVQLAEAKDHAEDIQIVSEELEAFRKKLTSELEAKRRELEHIEDHAARLIKQLEELRDQSNAIEARVEQSDDKQKEQREQLSKVSAEIEAKKAEIAKEIELQKKRKPAFAVIPYVGPNGTSRRPVYLECSKDGVTVQPEGLLIKNEDLKPPFGPGNPLDSALRILRVAYQKKDATFGINQPPYPLLMVRPDGIQSYALARAAMGSWDDQFGYELIENDLVLAFPPSIPGLREQLISALDLAKKRHAALASAIPRQYRETQDWGEQNELEPSHREESPNGNSRPFGGRTLAGGSTGSSSGLIEFPNAKGNTWEVVQELSPGQLSASEAAVAKTQNRNALTQPAVDGKGGVPNNFNKFSSAQIQGQYGHSSQPTSAQYLSANGLTQRNNSEKSDNSNGSQFDGDAKTDDIRDANGQQKGSGRDENAGQSVSANSNAGNGQGAASASGGSSQGSDSTGRQAPSTIGNGGQDPLGDSRANAFSSGTSGSSGAGGIQSMGGSVSPNDDPAQPQQLPNVSMSIGSSANNAPKDAKQNGTAKHVNSEGDLKPISVGAGRGWAASRAEGKATPVSRPINIVALSDRWLLRSEEGSMTFETTITMENGPQQAGEQLASKIRSRVDSWGLSVPGGYWCPTLTIEAASDSAQSVARLQRLLEGSGVEIRVVPLQIQNRR